MTAYTCDIILLSYESPGLLEKCVRSVLDHTRVRSRLIIVDNASKDPEVRDYLNSVHGNVTVEIEKIFSAKNDGFAAGMNKGMHLAGSPYVCLLNNDCVVTDGWLEEMISVAESDRRIGLVNPQSNTFGSCPGEGVSIDEHAASLDARRNSFIELGHAIGFACLVKKEVIDRIGYLDETYEGVCYEDTDFSNRARQEGYISVIAESAYVFHEEQASRSSLKGKEKVYKKNREIFEQRWGRLLRILYVADGKDRTGKDLSSTYERLKMLARERAIINVWTAADKKDIHTGKHADIGIREFPCVPGPVPVLVHVITKKKKYDAVIFEKERPTALFSCFRFLHNTELFHLENGSLRTDGGKVLSLDKSAELAAYLRGRKSYA